jgi:hypothetical protein
MFLLINVAIVVAAYMFYRMFEGNTDWVRGMLTNKSKDEGVLKFSVEKSEARARFG